MQDRICSLQSLKYLLCNHLQKSLLSPNLVSKTDMGLSSSFTVYLLCDLECYFSSLRLSFLIGKLRVMIYVWPRKINLGQLYKDLGMVCGTS